MSTGDNFGLQLICRNAVSSEIETSLDNSIKLCKKILLTDIKSTSEVISIMKEIRGLKYNATNINSYLLPSIVVPHKELITNISRANYYLSESAEDDYV